MMKWCLMSSDVSWHIRDKLWPMPKHGAIILYVHGRTAQDGQLDSHTAPELWARGDDDDDELMLNVLRFDILGTSCDQCRSTVFTGSDKECIIQASYDFELGCSETSGLPLPHKFNSPDHSKVSKHAHSYNYRRENLYWKCTVWIATAHSVTVAPIGSKLQPNLDVSASENTITHREGLSQNPLDFTSFKTARD